MHWKRWYDCVSRAFRAFFEDEKESKIKRGGRKATPLAHNTHTTGDMQKRAAEIVDEFLTDIFGEELKPWQKSGKTEKELSA